MSRVIVAPVAPEVLHAVGVSAVENVTGSPDDAVAVTVIDAPTATSGSVPNVIVWSTLVTVNDCTTGGAALNTALPAWSACTVHVPPVSNVTSVPATVHTAGVVVVSVTGRADDAVAVTANGVCAVVRFAIGPNVIAWSTLLTAKLSSTASAAANVPFPAWSACTVHVPAPTRVIVAPLAPLDVHTVGVVLENVTARFDDALASTVSGVCCIVRSASGPKVIVCGARVHGEAPRDRWRRRVVAVAGLRRLHRTCARREQRDLRPRGGAHRRRRRGERDGEQRRRGRGHGDRRVEHRVVGDGVEGDRLGRLRDTEAARDAGRGRVEVAAGLVGLDGAGPRARRG